MRDGPSTSTSMRAADEPLRALGRVPLHGLHQALHPLALDLVGELPVEVGGLRPAPRRRR